MSKGLQNRFMGILQEQENYIIQHSVVVFLAFRLQFFPFLVQYSLGDEYELVINKIICRKACARLRAKTWTTCCSMRKQSNEERLHKNVKQKRNWRHRHCKPNTMAVSKEVGLIMPVKKKHTHTMRAKNATEPIDSLEWNCFSTWRIV